MEMYTLSNEQVRIKIHPHGAELKELYNKTTGKNLLWNSDPAFWNRSSPVLFPFVGMVRDKIYRHEGKEYAMGQHGFARDMDFTMISAEDEEIWFALESDEDTLKKYPFLFHLEIGYRLKGGTVTVMWKVKNIGDDKMYFSIGAHPAFLCPLEEGSRQDQYAFLLKNKEGVPVSSFVNTIFGTNGLVTRNKEERSVPGGILPLEKHLFDHDALVIEDSQISEVSILAPDSKPYLTLQFDAPVVGLWSPPKKQAPFVCIEPWYGRCDKEGFDGELKDREWSNTLEPGEEFSKEYRIVLD